MQLRTTRVMEARRAFARQFELVRRGVALEGESGIAYSFTKLNEVKPAMIAEATRDARAGAEQFARDSATSVGTTKQATQSTEAPRVGKAWVRTCRSRGWPCT